MDFTKKFKVQYTAWKNDLLSRPEGHFVHISTYSTVLYFVALENT